MRVPTPTVAPCAPTAAVTPQPRTRWHRVRTTVATVATAALVWLAPPALAADPPPPASTPATIFTKSCAGCHAGGGNVVAPGATLFPDALTRGGVDTQEGLYELIYSGRNRMPGYGEKCEPRGACTFGARLTDAEVEGLTAYVLQRAGEGWK